MKKALAMLLTLILLLGVCSVPGMAEENVTTIRMFMPYAQMTDMPVVQDAVNEVIYPKFGFKVELVGGDDYYNQIPLKLADPSEQVDLFFNTSGNGYYSLARNGAMLDITDLLADYPELVSAVASPLWEGSRVDGRNYGVPTNKEYPSTSVYYVDSEAWAAFGGNIEDVKTYKDLEPYMAWLQENTDRFILETFVGAYPNRIPKLEYGDATPGFGAVVMPYDQPGTFVNWYATEEYMEAVKTMNDWYAKGYIIEDIVNVKQSDYWVEGKLGISWNSYSPFNELTKGVPVECIFTSPVVVTTQNTAASMWCVAAKSEYATECMQFLQEWNTNPVVKNLLTFGVEGRQFTTDENGRRVWIDEGWYAYHTQNWQMGNMLISQLEPNEPDNKWEVYEEFNTSAIDSPPLGFNPVTDEIADKMAAINGVVAEYCPLLEVGLLDAEEYVPVLLAELEAVGINEVVAWYQAQFDAWKAAQ